MIMELHNGHLNIVEIGKNVKKEEEKRWVNDLKK